MLYPKLRHIIIFILIILLGLSIWKVSTLTDQVNKLKFTKGILEQDLKSKLEVADTIVRYTYKTSTGIIRAIERTIPVEGTFRVVETVDGSIPDVPFFERPLTEVVPTESTGTFILIQKGGFTFVPAVALTYDFNDLNFGLETRLFFYKDYGIGIGGTYKYFYGFIDYRMTMFNLDNVTFGVILNHKLNPGIKIGISLN